MNTTELKTDTKYARKYGFAVGLLRGLILQSKKLGRKYIIDENVFEKVKQSLEELEGE